MTRVLKRSHSFTWSRQTKWVVEKQVVGRVLEYRAGFSLSRALFRKKCVGPLPAATNPIFPGKKTGDLFSVITVCQLSLQCRPYLFLWKNLAIFVFLVFFTRSLVCRPLFPACCYVEKICRFSCGGPFLWGPLLGRTCWTCLNPPLLDYIMSVRASRGEITCCDVYDEKLHCVPPPKKNRLPFYFSVYTVTNKITTRYRWKWLFWISQGKVATVYRW